VDDQAIIVELEKLREPARRCFEHYANQQRLGVWLQRPSPDISDLVQPIAAVLAGHPQFGNPSSRFFGAKQLSLGSHFQGMNLLRLAVDQDPAAAVEWLHKIFSTEVADLRYVAVVYGLKIADCLVLGNGVTLVPLEALPPSANASAVRRQTQVWPGPTHHSISMMFPIGAMLEVPQVPAMPAYESASDNKAPPRSDVLERTVSAFTLVDGATPVIGASWLEFADIDLANAEIGQTWMGPTYEGVLSFVQETKIDDEAVAWVNKYLDLGDDVMGMCDVAIERLNLARRRQSPGNKAIEGAICLEALLGDNDNRELTYKLALRAALLLATGLAARREIKEAVSRLYKLRSSTVHGRPSKTAHVSRDAACAAKGLEICTRALQEIVRRNEKPTPGDWELSGGAPLPIGASSAPTPDN
jgi:hypothetical protein